MQSRIQKGSGVYICADCGNKTRDTAGEGDSGLCRRCYEKAEWINYVSDGGSISNVPEAFRAEVAEEFGLPTEPAKTKFTLATEVQSEAGGYFVIVRRWWRGADGRVNLSHKTYHTNPTRGKQLMVLLMDQANCTSLVARDKGVR